MNRILRRISIIFMICILFVNTAGASGGSHWVYEELSDFKQRILPLIDQAIQKDSVTKEEFMSVHAEVLNDSELDNSIAIYHWASLLKITLQLPADKADSLLNMYVYAFADRNQIYREDAIGGMVKLLTLNHIKGSASAEDLKASEVLSDLDTIHEKQRTLVQMAYQEGLLDGSVEGSFRPKDKLTNAEAISLMYRVLTNLDPIIEKEVPVPVKAPINHWFLSQLSKFIKDSDVNEELKHLIQKMYENEVQLKRLNNTITIENWDKLMRVTLDLQSDESKLKPYTFGLTENNFITRDMAIIPITKLRVADPRNPSDSEKAAASKAFTDFHEAYDPDKLAIAYQSGLIQGYPDSTFRPKQYLTYAEAFSLIIRMEQMNKAN